MKQAFRMLLAIAMLATLTFGQTSTADIYGTVVLPDGSAIPGVAVTLTGDVIGQKALVTSEEGNFRFLRLPPGNYQLKFELEGFKSAMKKDGVALVECLHWLKNTIGKETITDYAFGGKLAEFRAKQEDFKGESFPPIVGYKSRGAIVHLHIGADDALPLEADSVVLFDSGGQYIDGTTDITRTVALGAVSDQFKTDFTLTLKGMIGLTQAKFPYGIKGCHLDILARQALWENGMNYGHGTGHGVGHFLNVHEGPMAIRLEYNENLMLPGQVLSNEPAFYREGQYGLRTENMMVCVERETTEFGRFLGFDTLTLCPIDTSLIKVDLLTDKERKWLNDYHQWVNAELKPLLEEKYHAFLDEITQEI